MFRKCEKITIRWIKLSTLRTTDPSFADNRLDIKMCSTCESLADLLLLVRVYERHFLRILPNIFAILYDTMPFNV